MDWHFTRYFRHHFYFQLKMKTKLKYESYALISILIAVLGQLAMKWGMSSFSGIVTYDWTVLKHVLMNEYVIIGFICYVASMFVWLQALKGLPLSYAFPLQSIGTVIIFLFSWFLLKEDISPTRWTGFAIILIGLYFLTRK